MLEIGLGILIGVVGWGSIAYLIYESIKKHDWKWTLRIVIVILIMMKVLAKVLYIFAW